MAICYPQVITSMDLLQSTIRLDRLGSFLNTNGVKLVAMTNSTLYGVQAFYQDMVRQTIQPVIGLRYNLELTEQTVLQVVSYARTEKGWKNLLKLSSALETKHVEALPLKWFHAYSEGLLTAVVTTQELYPQLDTLLSPQIIPAVTRETAEDRDFIQQLKKIIHLFFLMLPHNLNKNRIDLPFVCYKLYGKVKNCTKRKNLQFSHYMINSFGTKIFTLSLAGTKRFMRCFQKPFHLYKRNHCCRNFLFLKGRQQILC